MACVDLLFRFRFNIEYDGDLSDIIRFLESCISEDYSTDTDKLEVTYIGRL